MKVQILTQNVQDIPSMEKGLNDAKALLKTIGLDVSFTYKPTTKKFTSEPMRSDVVNSGHMIRPSEIYFEGDEGYDITCLIYSWKDIVPRPTNPVTYTSEGRIPMQIPVEWYTDFTVNPIKSYPETLTQFFLHELSHAIEFMAKSPDNTHDIIPGNQTSINYYLSLIKGNIPFLPKQTMTTTPKYKYFTAKEVTGLKPELVALLDNARGLAGTPFIITSGLRSVVKNKLVGGKANSSHLTGEAVDIACTDSAKRFKMVTALLKVGFNRIEVTDKHIHVDISKTLPQNVFFLD